MMGDTTQDIVKQQQPTMEKTELCIGVKLYINEKTRAIKHELIVSTHKIVQLEERSELCISKIGVKLPVREKMREYYTRDSGCSAIRKQN